MINASLRRTAATTVAALALSTGTTASFAATTAPRAASTGTIRVKIIHNYGTDHAKGRQICALATGKKHDKILGKCDIVNAAGIAVLKHVPAGTCNIGAYMEFQAPYARAKHKLTVHGGQTTKYTWHFNEGSIG